MAYNYAYKFDEAIKLLEPLAERYPQHLQLLELLSICYASANLLNEARDTLEQALQAEPLNAGLHSAMCIGFE